MASKTQTEPLPSPPDTPAPDLLRDLLDPGLTSFEVIHRHGLDPAAFRAAVQSQAFREAAEALRDADQERTELLTPLMHARALHTLARIANQPTTTPSQTESARRACTALIKARRPAGPALPSSPGGTGVPPVRPARQADLQSATQPKPAATAPHPNPLADITGDPTLTYEDSLRLIAEIDAMRGRSAPRAEASLSGGKAIPPVLPDPATRSTPAAQLIARAGAAP